MNLTKKIVELYRSDASFDHSQRMKDICDDWLEQDAEIAWLKTLMKADGWVFSDDGSQPKKSQDSS